MKSLAIIVLSLLSAQALALGDQWYLGVGGGVSRLVPNPEDSTIDRTDDQGTLGTIYIGRDFDSRSSGQFQLYSLGEVDLNNSDSVTYTAAEAALIHRFYDSRDGRSGNPVAGVSIYGRFGLGYLNRDSGTSLASDSPVFFGAGAGLEGYLTDNFGLRLEGQYFDNDAAAVSVSLVGRFGGLRRDLARRPPPISPQTPTFPQSAAAPPAAPQAPADSDLDGLIDEQDSCPQSPTGFPVGKDGCGLLDGDIQGLRFENDSTTLVQGSTDALDELAQLLVEHPDARIQLYSHTDATGSETEQSRRTRGRLRSVGVYLVNQGVRSNQLVLRSFAAKRPEFDNNTEQGRLDNNRIEVFEFPR